MPEGSGSAGYRAVVERVGLFSDLRRAVVAVSGAGALRVVNGLASNDVTDVPLGRGVYSFLLDRRGRVVADLRILPTAGFERDAGDAGTETVWLDAPGDALPPLMDHLRTYVPPMLAGHRETSVSVHTLIGPRAAGRSNTGKRLRKSRVCGSPANWPHSRRQPYGSTAFRPSWFAGRRSRGPGSTCMWTTPAERERRNGFRDSWRAPSRGRVEPPPPGEDWEILRLERGLPVFGSELGAERLAQEAGQDDRAISFAKGCFTGQEVVARIHYRGHVNRHLRGLRWTPNTLHAARDLVGAELQVPSDTGGGKPVGLITSAVHSPRFGPIGLGYLRREIAIGAVLESVGHPGIALQVTEVPFTCK